MHTVVDVVIRPCSAKQTCLDTILLLPVAHRQHYTQTPLSPTSPVPLWPPWSSVQAAHCKSASLCGRAKKLLILRSVIIRYSIGNLFHSGLPILINPFLLAFFPDSDGVHSLWSSSESTFGWTTKRSRTADSSKSTCITKCLTVNPVSLVISQWNCCLHCNIHEAAHLCTTQVRRSKTLWHYKWHY